MSGLFFGEEDANEDYTGEIKKPKVGTFQIVRVDEAEVKESADGKWNFINVTGAWVEYSDLKFFTSIFFPREDEKDEEKKQVQINRFTSAMKAFEVRFARGAQFHEIADALIGRFSVGKVGIEKTDRDGEVREFCKPTFYRKPNKEEAAIIEGAGGTVGSVSPEPASFAPVKKSFGGAKRNAGTRPRPSFGARS